MKNSNIQSQGRLLYVEPNNVYNNLPNGIPHPYEDYCISVDFTVEFGNRDSCGYIGYGNGNSSDNDLHFSSDKGTINFIGGTNGFLTTNFTDIESTRPDRNTNECLGIESIDITYSSWYIPQVNIKFVDVRGASLMSPHEQGYLNTVKNEQLNGASVDTSINGGSFFKALFSFPYPMFKLKVKGFYGKEVTYNLSVEDFKANFNAETGHFEIDAKFIGYMFGVYTDVPMNLVMIAPYIEGKGREYWAQRGFKYLDNVSTIKTYPELRKLMAEASATTKNAESTNDIWSEEISKLSRKISALEKIQTSLNACLEEAFNCGYFFIELTRGNAKTYYVCGVSTIGNIIITEKLDVKNRSAFDIFGKLIDWFDKVFGDKTPKDATSYRTLLENISNYNKEFQESLSEQLNCFGWNVNGWQQAKGPAKIDYKLTESEDVVIAAIDGAVKNRLYRASGLYEGKINIVGITNEYKKDITKYIYDNFIKGKGGTYYLYLQYSPLTENEFGYTIPEWIINLGDRINKLREEKLQLENERQKTLSVKVSTNLGFNPTIGNAFRMAFAHLDTFMAVFHRYLSDINDIKQHDPEKRSLKVLGFTKENTDLPPSFSESNAVPPFTMFYKEVEEGGGSENSTTLKGRKKVPIWPGELPGDSSGLLEIDFVNKLIDAAKSYSEKIREDLPQDEDVSSDGSIEFLPLTNYDILHGGANPYDYLSTLKQGNLEWPSALLTLILRAYNWYYCATSAYTSTLTTEAAGRIEAENLFKASPRLSPTFKEGLKSCDNADKFISFVIDYFTTESRVNDRKAFDIPAEGSVSVNKTVFTKEMSYDWIKKNENNENKKLFFIGNGNPAKVNFKDDEKWAIIGSEGDNTAGLVETFVIDENNETELTKSLKDLIEKKEKLDNDTKDQYKFVLHDFAAANKYCFGTLEGGKKAYGSEYGKIPNYYHAIQANSSSYYIKTPAYIDIAEEGVTRHQLYGHPFFYEQNNTEDDRDKKLAKAFLLCMGIPIATVDESNQYLMCAAEALWEGALYFEYNYRRQNNFDIQLLNFGDGKYKLAGENEVYLVKTLTDKDNKLHLQKEPAVCTFISSTSSREYLKMGDLLTTPRTHAEQRLLMTLFENWALKVFPDINNKLELDMSASQIKKLAKDAFNIYQKDKAQYKFGNICNLSGNHTSAEFYDKEGLIIPNRGISVELPVKKESYWQGYLIHELFAKQYIYINTNKVGNNIPLDSLKNILRGFYKQITERYKNQLEDDNNEPVLRNQNENDAVIDNNIKLATYLTLKNLYDRWLCGNRNKYRWTLSPTRVSPEEAKKREDIQKSEFSHFKFIDSFYHNIEDQMVVNTESIVETASQMMASSNIDNTAVNMKYVNQSFYEFLANICQKNEMLFLTLPMENEFTNPQGIADMFDVIPYSKMDERDTSCYVCIYTNRASQFLDTDWNNPSYMYASDGFNIANATGNILESKFQIPQISEYRDGDYYIPSFGVTYAKQNQSVFKKINVNMQNPQVTEASIATTQLIASKASEGVNQTALYGQDLYRIYANYSYTCVVEMMGNAQIMPLTYFQLNNIPLFRGVYLIIKIEHSIRAGDMVTRFTGVRMSKYDTPFISTNAIVVNGERDVYVRYTQAIDTRDFDSFMSEYHADNVTPIFTRERMIQTGGSFAKYNKDHPNDKLDNDPAHVANSAQVETNITELSKALNELQDAWRQFCKQNSGKNWAKYTEFYITSAFRSAKTNSTEEDSPNSVVGGAKNSDHTYGTAADIKLRTPGGGWGDTSIDMLFDFIIKYYESRNKKWGQIINEKASGKWVHFSYKKGDNSLPCTKMLMRNSKYIHL